MFRQIFTNRFIGEDRCPVGERPPVLRRRTIYVLAAICLVGILYGTLMPFQESAGGGRFDGVLDWVRPGPGDAMLNVLLYIPVGICIRLIIRRRDRSQWLQVPATVLLATALSLLTEYLQAGIASRISSLYDVCYNSLGGGFGALLAARAQTFLRNLHAVCFLGLRHRPLQTCAWLLGVAVLISLLAPFDLRLNAHSLRDGLNAAKFTPFPADYYRDRSIVTSISEPYKEVLNDAGTAGMFLAFGFVLMLACLKSGITRWRCAGKALCVLWAVATCAEIAQILTRSHRCDLWDILLAGVSGTIGVYLSVKLHDRIMATDSALPIQLVGVALAAHFLYVAAHALSPFYFGMKAGMLEAWILTPFAGEFQRARMGIPGDSVLEFLRYFVLALLLIGYNEAQRRRVRGWPIVGLVVSLVTSLELIQIFLADRFADTTTTVLALAGAAFAWAIYRAVAYDLLNCSVLAGPLVTPVPTLLDRWEEINKPATIEPVPAT